MKNVIRQIGTEGRTTIPQELRDAMGIRDGDFLAFELTQDGRHLVLTKVGMCPKSIPQPPPKCREPQPPKKRSEPQMPEQGVMVTAIVPDIAPEDMEKVLFVLQNMFGAGGGPQ